MFFYKSGHFVFVFFLLIKSSELLRKKLIRQCSRSPCGDLNAVVFDGQGTAAGCCQPTELPNPHTPSRLPAHAQRRERNGNGTGTQSLSAVPEDERVCVEVWSRVDFGVWLDSRLLRLASDHITSHNCCCFCFEPLESLLPPPLHSAPPPSPDGFSLTSCNC